MSGASPILTKTFNVVGGTVPEARRLVRQGIEDGAVNRAIGDTQPLLVSRRTSIRLAPASRTVARPSGSTCTWPASPRSSAATTWTAAIH